MIGERIVEAMAWSLSGFFVGVVVGVILRDVYDLVRRRRGPSRTMRGAVSTRVVFGLALVMLGASVVVLDYYRAECQEDVDKQLVAALQARGNALDDLVRSLLSPERGESSRDELRAFLRIAERFEYPDPEKLRCQYQTELTRE